MRDESAEGQQAVPPRPWPVPVFFPEEVDLRTPEALSKFRPLPGRLRELGDAFWAKGLPRLPVCEPRGLGMLTLAGAW